MGSVLSGSLALLADTAHAALDGASALISVFVAHAARSHQNPERMRVRWMRVSGAILLLALVWICYEAYERFTSAQAVFGPSVMVAASIGALINYAQHRLVPHDHSVTAKAQRLHVLSDLASSILVVLGGGLIWLTGIMVLDPVISLVVVGVVGYSTITMMLNRNTDHSHHGHPH